MESFAPAWEHRVHSFQFKECITILKPTGRSVRTLRELREGIREAPGPSLFHHTFEYFIHGSALHYTNDFAQWAGQSLEEQALAEHLSALDPYDCGDTDELRSALLSLIDRYLTEFPEPREVLPGNEFFFSENFVVSFPIGVRAKNLAEFLIAIRFVDARSIYYHFFDARTRLREERNDFSLWLEESLGKKGLADRIAGIDPFMHPLEGIRQLIVQAVEEELQKDMEGFPA